jgi:hypothetical protein
VLRLGSLWIACLLIAVAPPATIAAPLQDENLLTPLPADFAVGYRASSGRIEITEYVPRGESVTDWSRLITVQIFHGLGGGDPKRFATQMAGNWQSACPGADVVPLSAGTTNGYPSLLWRFSCPLNPETQKPENMWLKAVSGADSLYVVQYAYRQKLSPELQGPAADYLDTVSVCDTRRTDRSCPAGI